jgi:hypothetical protein
VRAIFNQSALFMLVGREREQSDKRKRLSLESMVNNR